MVTKCEILRQSGYLAPQKSFDILALYKSGYYYYYYYYYYYLLVEEHHSTELINVINNSGES